MSNRFADLLKAAEESIDSTDRATLESCSAGVQSLPRMERQMCPLLYTCACCGATSPLPTTKYVDGESNGYCEKA